MHSSMMRTAGSLPYRGLFPEEVSIQGVSVQGVGSPFMGSLSMGVSVQGVSVRERSSPADRQRCVKILPCPKLRLRTVIATHSNQRCLSSCRHSSVGAAPVCGLIGPRLEPHYNTYVQQVCGRDQEVGRCPSMSFIKTRMHSSRMRTTRLLTVSQHALPGGGVCPEGVSAQGECLSRGSVCPGGVSAQEVSAQGSVGPGGVYPSMHCLEGCLPRGCLPGGKVSAQGCVYPSMH